METTTYSFSNFPRTHLKRLLGLKRVWEHKLMNLWLKESKKYKISEIEIFILKKWRKVLSVKSDTWNETELQMHFIGPLLALINFTNSSLEISAFAERNLEKKINHFLLQGKIDWMVAAGDVEPEQPFFFIHEYKRGLKGSNDPVGQLVATMYVAQQFNQEPLEPSLFDFEPVTYENLPIYGCYVVGRSWFFVVLKEKDYYISKSYDATDEEKLYEIVKLLKAQKQMIIDRVLQNQ